MTNATKLTAETVTGRDIQSAFVRKLISRMVYDNATNGMLSDEMISDARRQVAEALNAAEGGRG